MKPVLAIYSESPLISLADLKPVAEAIQIQVSRDLQPHWNVDATIIAVESVAQVPKGAWRAVVKDRLEYDVYGYHIVDEFNVPIAYLRWQPNWTVTLSHEIVETLVNPYGNRVMSGHEFYGEPRDNDPTNDVEYLVEISDPSQTANDGYEIKGVRVSDFFLPSFYDFAYTEGKQYSFTGAIKRPLTLADGGYISFRRVGEWYQAFQTSNRINIKKLSTGQTLTTAQQRRFNRALLIGAGSLIIVGIVVSILKRRKSYE